MPKFPKRVVAILSAPVLLGLGSAPPAMAAASPVPTGLWLNPHHSVAVETGACQGKLCGRVVWASASALADAREEGVQHLLGTMLLENYWASGANAWSGTVYVPDMGRRFSSHIDASASDHLRIAGCLLGSYVCKSQVWTHIDRLPRA